MSTTPDIATVSLPEDLASCHELLKGLVLSLGEREQRIAQLEAQIDALIRNCYGPKRERYVDPKQGLLFGVQAESTEPPAAETTNEEAAQDEPPRKKKRRGGTGRRRLDENLRREQLIHRLREDQKQCTKCGAQLVIVLVDGALQWCFRPAEIYGLQHVHEKGFCQCCHEHVVQAEKPPQMIEKGAADAALLAHVTTCNKGDHLPTYRYEEISLRHGWWIPRSTQVGWLAQTAVTSVILYSWMASRVLNGKLLGTDATGVRVLEPGSGQTQKGTIWVYCGQQEVCPYLIYEYSRHGGGETPRRFLDGYTGYLQADAASVFDQLYLGGMVFEVACGAHMRRYFYKARHSAPLEAHRALVYFRQLYLLERELADASDEERCALRQARALPMLAEFKTWLDTLAPRVVPKTELASAVGYALNQWDAFLRYCDQGWLLIDNTRSERALRPIAIGRNNWLFFGSDGGGRTGAILYSLVASAKANRIHPYFYLEDVYQRLPLIREHEALRPLLRQACGQVELADGLHPRMELLETPLDYLRVLKDHPRPLIELLRDDSQLDAVLVAKLNALLPDHWLAEHPESRLEINRRTRLVGEAA
jgi:transposase